MCRQPAVYRCHPSPPHRATKAQKRGKTFRYGGQINRLNIQRKAISSGNRFKTELLVCLTKEPYYLKLHDEKFPVG